MISGKSCIGLRCITSFDLIVLPPDFFSSRNRSDILSAISTLIAGESVLDNFYGSSWIQLSWLYIVSNRTSIWFQGFEQDNTHKVTLLSDSNLAETATGMV